ncbi:hypothetical protein Tco_0257495 [Tanacetum coccineum]
MAPLPGKEKRIKREQAANLAVQKEEHAAQSFTPYWNFPIIDDDDDEHTIQYSVEDLVPIPSESEGIFNMCDVPSCDKKHFDAESDLRESLLNRDTSIVYSSRIESLLEEFAGELASIAPIPPGINKAPRASPPKSRDSPHVKLLG